MSDFKVNDKVIHCREGLSVIDSVKTMCERDYFVVHSIGGDGEAIYVPIATAETIIRRLMTPKEADDLLSSLKAIDLEFNPNTKQRRDAYKKRLSTGDVKDIAYLYRQEHLCHQNEDKVRLGPADLDMLGYAKKCLLDELALVYEIDREKIEEFALTKIK